MGSVSKNNEAAILIAPSMPPRARAPLFETRLPAPLLVALPIQRRRIWDLHTNLHCSIIGTCFSTAELRVVLGRIGCLGVDKSSEHELHSQGVALAGKPHAGAKLLHKALDRKYKSTIGKFDSATSVESLQSLWKDFLQQGDIPGAYWAILTHPKANQRLIQNVFGEVHMLSHLVGAANRADIRRLRQMEIENSELQDKVARQQSQLRDAITKRDDAIRELRRELQETIARHHRSAQGSSECSSGAKDTIIVELDRKLKRAEASRASLEDRLAAAQSDLESEKKLRLKSERLIEDLKNELQIVEGSWASEPANAPASEGLRGKILLYVGGRSHHISNLRRLTEERGAKFLHHDGGVEEASDLLSSLAARADAIFFPIDCVSHGAVAIIKRVCRQTEKPYLPLRSSGLTSFAAALGAVARSEE
jgi:hypothetical protein